MIEINVPAKEKYKLKFLVLDYNGTLACDGIIVDGVAERLNKLSDYLKIYIITADTFGNCIKNTKNINTQIHVIDHGYLGSKQKLDFINELGKEYVVAIGNGENDKLMLENSALGIIVLGEEGISVNALNSADILVKNINDALNMLLNEKRIIATLRE